MARRNVLNKDFLQLQELIEYMVHHGSAPGHRRAVAESIERLDQVLGRRLFGTCIPRPWYFAGLAAAAAFLRDESVDLAHAVMALGSLRKFRSEIGKLLDFELPGG